MLTCHRQAFLIFLVSIHERNARAVTAPYSLTYNTSGPSANRSHLFLVAS
jgi:hypothetical protein